MIFRSLKAMSSLDGMLGDTIKSDPQGRIGAVIFKGHHSSGRPAFVLASLGRRVPESRVALGPAIE